MAITYDPELSDVLNDAFVAGVLSVTTSQVEAKVGASRLEGRENLRIYNNSAITVYYGPTGVTASTGEPIYRHQSVNIPVGEAIGVFLITASGTASDVRIQEWA